MKTYIFVCLTLLLFIEKAISMFIVLEPSEIRCIIKKMKTSRVLKGRFYVTGESETSNIAYILDTKGQKWWEVKNQSQGDFNVAITVEGEYSLCFESKFNRYLTVSFNFYDGKEENNLISAQSIQDMNQNVHELRKKVDIIHNDMRNSVIRRTGHVDSKLI